MEIFNKLQAFFPSKNHTPSILQMEAVECGAASLAMILAHHGRWVALDELRYECDVSRDGSKASNIVQAARKYGLDAQGYKLEPEVIKERNLPAIIHWNFNHFVVLEKLTDKKAYINDPAAGPRTIPLEEFDEAFTGILLEFTPGPDFKAGGERTRVLPALFKRLGGAKTALLYIMLASLALIIPGLLIPGFSKIFVDNYLVQGYTNWIMPILLGIFLTAICRAVLTWIQQHYLLRLESRLAMLSSSQFLWHLMHLPMAFFSQRYAGEITQRITSNDKVASLIAGQLGTNLINILTVIFYGIVMCFYSPLLTIIGISLTSLNVIMLKWVANRRANSSKRLLQAHGKLMATAMGGLQMIETFKASGSEADFFNRWAGHHAKTLNAEQELSLIGEPLMILPTILNAITSAIILGIGGLEVMAGHLSIGSIIAFQSLMASFNEPINNLLNLGGHLQEVSADLQRLDDVLRYQQAARYQSSEQNDNYQGKLAGLVEFHEVTFGYSRLSEPLIKNFSLTIKPGARIALVGRSGSGKSTIAKLISGHYVPWSGEILLDGKPLSSLPWQVICNSLATVDQEIFLYEGTIRDNLTLWDQTTVEEDVIQAAKDADIHEMIIERPNGYQSLIEESGRNFSGGQRQRLEIARALVNNPSILVLDEATSALDPKVEYQIDNNIRRRGCTCLIIAHRLSTIRECDEIIVLDKGNVVQRGRHEDLIAQEGAYKNLITTT
jgi:NHLM bacteriocin system ABC transporter peptidase/ATP-binding protein